jgi:very-short-patch-repair endonuclease
LIVSCKEQGWYTKEIKNKKYGLRKRISSRHVDFLLLDKTTFQPVMAIELDGKSHNSAKAQEADAFKNQLFNHVGLPLHRIHVGENFEEKVKEVLG